MKIRLHLFPPLLLLTDRQDPQKMKTISSKRFWKFLPIFFISILNLFFAKTDFAQPEISSGSGVIINEVLANEPGSYTSLEWVELYNADSTEHDLGGWSFVCKDDTTLIPAGTTIPDNGFLILSRKLLSEPPDSISFEAWWGDGSGTWRDCPEESFPAIQVKMSLINSGGAVSLVDPETNVQTFNWDKDCGDGVSLERVSSEDNIWLCCVDSDKNTPGRKNSVSTPYSDRIKLHIQPNPFSPDGDGFEDQTVFYYTLTLESSLTIRIYDVQGRLIRTLMEDQPAVSGEISWDGKDEHGKTVRVGIYIVWAEAEGNSYSQKKTTVVVAKR